MLGHCLRESELERFFFWIVKLAAMKTFLTFFVLAAAFALPACSGETLTATQDAAPAVVCCGGNCDTPAGTCCSDGTCHGNHAELPLAP